MILNCECIAIMKCRYDANKLVLNLSPEARQQTGDSFFATVSVYGDTISIYTETEWNSVLERVQTFPESGKKRMMPVTKPCVRVMVEQDGQLEIPEHLVDIVKFQDGEDVVLYKLSGDRLSLRTSSTGLYLSTYEAYQFILESVMEDA